LIQFIYEKHLDGGNQASRRGEKMKILVTGALGTIGRHLVSQLRERGHEVWLLDLRHYHDTQYIRCDVSSYQQLAQVFDEQDFDVVYHLAAEFGRWNGERYYDTLWNTNVVNKNMIAGRNAEFHDLLQQL
jgi:dTDP-glucose 4,6-dehydratase